MSFFSSKRFMLSLCAVGLMFSSVSPAKSRAVEPADPVIYYHFKVQGEFSGGEDVWVNNVHLGKMPFTMTREEFLEKVPFMEEPPEGYADENKHKMNGYWFRIQIYGLEKENNKSTDWSVENKNYYARVKLNDEWGLEGHDGGGGGGGGGYRQDYNVYFRVKFPSREKLIAEKEGRFKDLLRIARLNDYQVGSEWYQTIDTYGDKGWRDLRYMPNDEPKIQKIMDGWALWKFQIDDPGNPKSATEGFGRICDFVNARKSYRFYDVEGRAVELIYEKLDLDELIKNYLRELKKHRRLTHGYTCTENKGGFDTVIATNHGDGDVVPASTSAIYHALWLWDQKLDAEDYHSDNPVELEVVPALLLKSKGRHNDFAFKRGLEMGGSVMATYLLRHNWRTTDPEDDKNVSINFDYRAQVNHWLVCLVNMDDPAGRKFRQQNSDRAMNLADKLCRDMHSDDGPPEFLFLDNELGRESIAWRYWEKYEAWVGNSFPSWAHEKLKKKYHYLVKMSDLVPLQMYLDVWHQTHKTLDQGDELYLSAEYAFQILPKEIRESFGKALLADCDTKMKSLEVRSMQYQDLYDLKKTIHGNLLYTGNEESVDNRIKFYGLYKKTVNWDNAANGMRSYRLPRPRYIESLSRHESPNIRELAVIRAEAFPIPENQKTLERLLNDPDPTIKQAAEGASAKLKQLNEQPLSELVAYPAEKEQD